MVNLIAERDVVPELVQTDFTPQRVCEALRRLIPDGPARRTMMEDFLEVRRRLQPGDSGGNASDRAAQAVLSMVRKSK
jgi:lipid-A-disaccharide synthase